MRQTLCTTLQGKGAGGSGTTAKNPLVGDIFVVTAQLAAATQFIIEEKYLTAYRVPALLAVGLEGMWGLAISAAALPAMSFVRWPDGTPVDVLPAAIRVLPNCRLQAHCCIEEHYMCLLQMHRVCACVCSAWLALCNGVGSHSREGSSL